jgi:hypothetical protein
VLRLKPASILRAAVPWRSFTIDTSWPPEVAAIEIRKVIDAPTLFGGGGCLPFVGTARGEKEFVFRRRIGYRNSFLPVIHAVVEPSHHGGARVRVRMRMYAVVIAFMAFWLTGASFGAGSAGVVALLHGQASGLLMLLFPLFGVAMVCVGFSLEARKAEKMLRALYAVAPALPPPPETGQAYR